MYESHPATIAKSILHRSLLKWWEARRGTADCPDPKCLLDEALQSLFTDCMIYEVSGHPDGLHFVAVFQGASAVNLYGQNVVGTDLVDHVNPKILETVIDPYLIAVEKRRPVFTIRPVRDTAGVPLSIETLRLPLARGSGVVEKILAHYCLISLENDFSRFALQDTGELPDNTVKAIIRPGP